MWIINLAQNSILCEQNYIKIDKPARKSRKENYNYGKGVVFKAALKQIV